MLRISVLVVLLLAAGCAATGSNGGAGNDGRCLYSVNGPRGQHAVWAPCDQPPPMMRQRLTEGRQD